MRRVSAQVGNHILQHAARRATPGRTRVATEPGETADPEVPFEKITRHVELGDAPVLLLVLIVLAGAEWVLRKRRGLP